VDLTTPGLQLYRWSSFKALGRLAAGCRNLYSPACAALPSRRVGPSPPRSGKSLLRAM